MRFLLSNFVSDVKTWGWNTAYFNARFLVALAILPGAHHHVSVRSEDEDCDVCE